MSLQHTGTWSVQQWKGLWWVIRPSGQVVSYHRTEAEALRAMRVRQGA